MGFTRHILYIRVRFLLQRARLRQCPAKVVVRCWVAWLVVATASAFAQEEPPKVTVGALSGDLRIDGVLDEDAWTRAGVIDRLTMVEPAPGGPPSMATRVRVLASQRHLVIGVECDDPEPGAIVSFSKHRDAGLDAEDHVAIALGTFQDGRSGYLFAVNPSGARFDGLIAPGSNSLNESWDGIWEAHAARTDRGWSVEFRIPVITLSFRQGLDTWHFNVQRRVQRLLETDRWAGIRLDYDITQTSQAGYLAGLPQFSQGLGLTVRPAVVGGGGIAEADASAEGDFEPSLDVQKTLGSNLLASLTVNTDFAETEADTRQTNLTRFPLFFPEKRTFFLEGADIFDFGLDLGTDIIPFFSRTIGLVGGQEVPIIVGGKLSGRVGATNLGALAVKTNDVAGVAPEATMAVVRGKQNILSESSVGFIATAGDPLGRGSSWTAGLDFTYRTSELGGDKNFLVGAWALAMDRQGLEGDRQAWGLKVDYPNDLWNLSFNYKRIGDAFDPSLGFVPRAGVNLFNLGGDFSPRPGHWVYQMFFQASGRLVTDLHGQWESYRVFTAPFNLLLASGDRFEFNLFPTGEYLVEPFEIADGVVIAPGTYQWLRYRVEIETARKRRLSALGRWWVGSFYDGTLNQIQLEVAWNPSSLFTVEFNGERNAGDIAAGRFTQNLIGTRLRVNVSPDLSISSYVQYDNESDTIGTNTRLRWTFRPQADLFVIYNHNVIDFENRWRLDSNQLLVKLQYAFRF